MSVIVEFPEELLVACREEKDFFQRRVMVLTLGKLYERGKILSGVGSKILGCDRSEFYHLIREQGFAVIDYTETEFEEEARTSRHSGDKLASL